MEFLSHGSESVKVRSSKQSSTKRWKRALEVVDHLGPGYYSCPFLVEKVTGGWRMVMDLSGLDCYVTYSLQEGNGVFSPRVNQKRDLMFSIDLKDTYFIFPSIQTLDFTTRSPC